MALAGSKDISEQRGEGRSLCTFLVAAPYGLWITTCPVLTFPFPSASHGLSTSKALSWALCNCYGCPSSVTITLSWDWGAALLVIMGHYVLADTYSAEIQRWFVKVSSTNEVHCSVWNCRTTVGWDIFTLEDFSSPPHRGHLLLFQLAQRRQRKFANCPLKRTCNPFRTRWLNSLPKVRLFFKSNKSAESLGKWDFHRSHSLSPDSLSFLSFLTNPVWWLKPTILPPNMVCVVVSSYHSVCCHRPPRVQQLLNTHQGGTLFPPNPW